jgi:hypothetical protein
MKFGRIFISLILAFPGLLAGNGVSAEPIPDDLFMEFFQALMGPVCRHSNETKGTSLDCDNPDPEVLACWREKIEIYYDQPSLLQFLQEAKASNEKYPYFNQPYYNEFFSDRNWDYAMDFNNSC